MPTSDIIAGLALAIWLYLLCARGGFWRGAQRDDVKMAVPKAWPSVVAIVPARNEAAGIGESIGSLLGQRYPGSFSVVLVDDDSGDGTAEIARRAASASRQQDRLTIVNSGPLPSGWTGKLWALAQGIDHIERGPAPPVYLMLTDADIVHAPDSAAWLVAKAEADGLVLTSLMAKLRCESLAEKTLVPAFIFFFQMVYPFAWVNRRHSATAAAAGGCVLARREDLQQAGGIPAIRTAVIDDCALAKIMKARGPIWLGLTGRVQSIRPYPHWGDIRRMVARSAYAQLRYSPMLLAGAIAGLALTFLAAPVMAIFGAGLARGLGLLTWALMALAFQPMLRFYRVSPWWGLALPAIAATYMIFTLDSAFQYARGRGASWKGRFQAKALDR